MDILKGGVASERRSINESWNTGTLPPPDQNPSDESNGGAMAGDDDGCVR